MGRILTLPSLIAHRGASAYAPENTFASIELAKAQGASWVEVDVALTVDGEPVIFHDESLERTTNGKGLLSELNYSALRSLDAGSWFDQKFKDERVPHLQAFLACVEKLGLGVNVELKPDPKRVQETVEKTVQHLEHHKGLLLLSSFNWPALFLLRKLTHQYPIGLLMDEWDPHWEKTADQLACMSIHVNYQCLTPQRILEIKHTGRMLCCYTVNEASLAKRLIDGGVDSVFSDYPNLF